MGLRERLERIVDGMPPGSAVSLSVEWLRHALEEEGVSGAAGQELLTLAQVAERCGRAVSTVRGWCNSGRLDGAFRLRGKDWRVPEPALNSFLQAEAAPKQEGREGTGDSNLKSWRGARARRGKAA